MLATRLAFAHPKLFLEDCDLTGGFLQMQRERGRQIGMLRGARHLAQRLDDLLLRIVSVAQLVDEEGMHRLGFTHVSSGVQVTVRISSTRSCTTSNFSLRRVGLPTSTGPSGRVRTSVR